MYLNPTIIALSTPPGPGALAIIRLSGPRSTDIFKQLIRPAINLKPRVVQRVNIFDGVLIIDHVIATLYKAPHSYTGENLIEISCHGSSYIINKIIKLCLDKGAVLAQPGEFTRRAFLNGKFDLTQAEAVADLVFSQTQLAHKTALALLDGTVGHEITALREKLINLISILEVELDFSENEIIPTPVESLYAELDNLLKNNSRLLNSYSGGKIMKQGALVPIIGPPNSGKSSLLNAFLNEERAIVTPYPGTTRDSIEETISKNGLMIRLLDTAGIRKTKNPIERIGIDRTFESVKKGDIILFVIDVTQPIKRIWQNYYKNKNTIIVINKIDIASNEMLLQFKKHFTNYSYVLVSAKKHMGIKELKKIIVDKISHQTGFGDSVIITNHRHANSLRKAKNHLLNTIKHLKQNLSPEMIVADLRMTLSEYDEIVGKTSSEDILNNIFKKFCIGK